ncbi:hypothetical protein CLV28_2499 [Sediminihabitans luteus]|uniref:Winged helix-turn-helix domain-containing protein n=1 Tax=Sediminihabitans luteus TaxID=1138585 RepID=A0A2M9CDT0_9CELL|nr:crosslink repair DNA glycosylase YcaQ family protein [Sediminihabitans luteus]PJJ70022.1 hypothetical protein CLV28_2499 [Sediminihabitans luteus]GII99343.1 hypothetical protein Slu03_17210 [Sediminihabitans luteus]
METLSIAQARRTALAAQGLARPRRAGPGRAPTRPPGIADLQRVVDRIGVLQIDSVNVLARAHLVPLYSRLGPYDPALLDRATERAPRRLLETWGHMASYVPPATYRLLSWRRRRVEAEAWGSIRDVVRSHPEVVARVREVVTEHGPVTATEVRALLEAEGHVHVPDRSAWGWAWSVAKTALEHLFFTGEIAAARRTASFERSYDLAERVVPPAALGEVSDADAVRGLLEIGARAHGVGTVRCFQDYFRLRGPAVRTALDELVEDGTLAPVRVEGWDARTYLHRDAKVPRTATARTLLSPFDPLVFERVRLERLHGVRFRIEIYVPAARREYGYYVLPFLEGERITARVDLRADRRAGTLEVLSAHPEPTAGPDTPEALAAELRVLADWLGLPRVDVTPRGALAPSLAGALASLGTVDRGTPPE